jgi:hypothetical protein
LSTRLDENALLRRFEIPELRIGGSELFGNAAQAGFDTKQEPLLTDLGLRRSFFACLAWKS